MALIDKVKAEIERRIKVAKVEYESTHAPEYEGIDIELNALLAFLDTLEAEEKDVDLEEHYKQWVERYKEQHDGDFPDAWAIVNHFYELGCRHTAEMYDDIEHERQRAEEAEPSGDLEEEIDKYFQGWINDDEYGDALMPDYTGVDVDKCKEIARHFAEWGAEHLRDTTKMIPEELEEAAEKYNEKMSWAWEAPNHPHKAAFIAGAKWQRKQDQSLIELAEDHAMLAGMNKMKEEMMEKAVAVEVVGDKRDLRLIDSTERCLFNAKRGDWLKVIVLPKEK